MTPIQSLGYSIFFEDNLSQLQNFISRNSYSKKVVLVDSNSKKYCLSILKDILTELEVIEIDPGEENKNIDSCIKIWNHLINFKIDRNSLLINLGGGVITDLGSFVAATFKRGIDFIQIPTTLLSQVDASIGGKTGVDMNLLKNVIGTFTQPKAVFIINKFLQTLDKRQLISGFAEVIKHGLILDAAFFTQLQQLEPQQITPEIIYQSIEIKNKVVNKDPLEKGLRKILNFGHTIGHAIESYSLAHEQIPLLHGEAVAIGLICESYLSHLQNGLSKDSLLNIQQTILSIYPKYHLKESTFSELIKIMKNDKKNDNGAINCSLLKKIGLCNFDKYCSEKHIYQSLSYYQNI